MPAGRPKTTQCMVLFEKLEAEGVIQLPPIKHSPKRKLLSKNQRMGFDTSPIEGEIREFEPLHLEIAIPGEAAFDRWKAYINQYHLLEYKIGFGSRLQYFIKSGDMELGCLQFSASAWALEHRDKWIGWSVQDKKERLHLIVNNSRFLIFPWVHIRNLASRALSLVAKQIQTDWLREYC